MSGHFSYPFPWESKVIGSDGRARVSGHFASYVDAKAFAQSKFDSRKGDRCAHLIKRSYDGNSLSLDTVVADYRLTRFKEGK